MKKIIFFVLFTTFSLGKTQTITLQPLLKDKISIRALVVSDGKIYYVGTNSKMGFVDYNSPKINQQITLSDKNLQFRTLAQDELNLYTISIESPAYFFKINKKSLETTFIYTDEDSKSFYDSLLFDEGKFYTFSDSSTDFVLKFISFTSNNNSFQKENLGTTAPKMQEGEAAFAASNSNIASSKKYLWLATGGKTSRIWRWEKNKKQWKIFSTPFVQGKNSQGMYAIDFYDNHFGVAVGGDYTQPNENKNNIATTQNGGKTWEIVASGKNAGYTTCVKIKPNSKGKEMISVGDNHISYSKDFGKSWTKISEEKGLYICQWIDENTVIFGGKDKILKGKLIFENALKK